MIGRTAIDAEQLFRVTYGVRWLRNDTTSSYTYVGCTYYAAGAPYSFPCGTSTSESDDLFGEIGMQFATPIGDTPHTVFAGAELGFGGSSNPHWVNTFFSDLSLGYQYSVSDNFRPYVRYRVQIFQPLGGGPALDQNQVVQGPEIGFSVRF